MSVRTPGIHVCAALLAGSGCYTGLDTSPAADGDTGADATAGVGEGDGDGNGSAGSTGGSDGGEPAAGCETPTIGASPLRRLTRTEYDNTVRDLLGVTSQPARDRLGPDEAGGGFEANAVAPISATTLEAYLDIAEDIAPLALTQLDRFVDCELAAEGCAADFIDAFGLRAFRRPLSDAEHLDYVDLYDTAAAAHDAETAATMVVEAMLLSPRFLYHVEPLPADVAETDVVLLGEYDLASRLSYFLWASMPDDELFAAAEAGLLGNADTREAQVRRMLEDDRASDAIASFHRQLLRVDNLDDKVKDGALFPEWSPQRAEALARETAAFADEVIRRGDGRLQTLFSASWTVGDDALAEIYGVAAAGPDGRIELDAEQRSGILTQAGFLAAQAHPAETSWVYRGLFVRENLLCEQLPPPPPGVEVSETNDPGRLENPSCAGCHVLMDPIGQGFDNYDAIGAYRDVDDQGQTIDAQGEVVGVDDLGAFENAVALSKQLAMSTVVHDCMALQWYRFATRRSEHDADQCAIDAITTQFTESDQDIAELIVSIARSDAFQYRRAALPA
jgi:hypothetical protein